MMINKMKLEEIYAANKQMIVVEPRKVLASFSFFNLKNMHVLYGMHACIFY